MWSFHLRARGLPYATNIALDDPAALTPAATNGRTRAQALGILVRLLMILGGAAGLLPLAALARGLAEAASHGVTGTQAAGIALAAIALLLGWLFFLYSVRYYVATLAMLVSSLMLADVDGAGDHRENGNGHPHGRMRFLRRGNGNGVHANGEGNGHLDIGYEPFVSIHIATFNEKRVIARLLDGCAALEYTNYEVVVVDDSTDETAAIDRKSVV